MDSIYSRSRHKLIGVDSEGNIIARNQSDVRIVAIVFIGHCRFLLRSLILLAIFSVLLVCLGFLDDGVSVS
jgi:hypothetical protein